MVHIYYNYSKQKKNNNDIKDELIQLLQHNREGKYNACVCHKLLPHNTNICQK